MTELLRPQAQPTLDVGGHFPFSLAYGPDGGLRLELDLSKATRKYLNNHLHELLQLQVDGQTIAAEGAAQESLVHRFIRFVLPPIKPGSKLNLSMNSQPVTSLVAAEHGVLQQAPKHHEYQLAPSEVRALGCRLRRDPKNPERDVLSKLPYDRAARAGFDPKKHAPITDVHTHYSAQVSGHDMFEVALAHDLAGEEIAYPIELLKLLNVYPALDAQQRPIEQREVDMEGRDFNPLREEGLKCETENAKCKGIRVSELTSDQRAAIIRKMNLPIDGTMSFSDFDREMYRYRNPFVKHPKLAKDMIKKVAEEYAAQGIEYAELSTASMLNPDWFRQMVEALEEIERDGVGPEKKKPVLRFLIGLPRNVSPQRTLIDLNKVKFLSRHPAIVGVDLLGYESTRISDFMWAFSQLAEWTQQSEYSGLERKEGWDFQRDFIIRVHAGETGKNPTNVSEAIKIAHDYNVRVRVGHGLNYKFDAETQAKLDALNARHTNRPDDPDLFATERAMDSNQVYRTKMLVHHQSPPVPGAPCFLGSDGSGAVGTNPVGLAYSALAAGWTLQDLTNLRAFEQGYISRQAARDRLEAQAFATHYGEGHEGLESFLEEYAKKTKLPKSPQAQSLEKDPLNSFLPPEYDSKKPILIAGASGTSWKEMTQGDREDIIRQIELLVKSCDPNKVYFVLGRTQAEGVSKTLDDAVKRHNRAHPDKPFQVLGRQAGASKNPSGDQAETITWLHDIPEGRDYVPASMLNFIREHHGYAIFFNGSDYTAEMAYGASDHRIPHALHDPRKGKMAEVAEITETDSVFRTVEDFFKEVLETIGENRFLRHDEDRASILRDGIDFGALLTEVKDMALRKSFRDREEPRTRS